ncbi:hypothetical protein A2773_01740 [Candidatus Gottesmanbacteria bacterium RIFCSPHIGHO2_01_FULL_39_10]|uniref:YtxH domain-containing protein n=1 Tax=Candidatus Gottesmanbacteria bacterium RIFCSPHIGHO2_01_FULL_39_10 TaxID=1798375 RepID=A0A1F5ZKI2_9BACT|nr:MAG: hypothetical protein A2773_01740 [Candidatus Gottesmanbacteria bacterium RIFCSPHIGHO2_01_FULL_39_10]
MINTHQKNQEKHKGFAGLIAAGVVVGAGVALAATLVLKNKKSQEKIKKVFLDAKDQVKESIEKLKKEPSYQSGKMKIKEVVKNINKTIS